MNAMDFSKELRRAVETGKVEFGVRSSQKNIFQEKTKLVVFSSNITKQSKEKIILYCGRAKIKTKEFEGNSLDLGKVCGKPFSVSCLSVTDEGKSKILE